MKTSIECEKCNAVYTVEFTTHKVHIVKTVCPFCNHTEQLEVGRDEDI